jgi:hypothetical protein
MSAGSPFVVFRAVLAVSIFAFILIGPAQAVAAQRDRDDEDRAVRRCVQELQYRMTREYGGRRPDVIVENRDARISRISNRELRVRGDGRYLRDRDERGRTFSFDCVFDERNGDVTRADYRWSGGSDDDRPGGFRPGGRGDRPDGSVWYRGPIINKMSRKGLDVEDESSRDQANVQQWGYGGKPNQRWDIIELGRNEYAIINQGSDKALEVAGASTRDGTNVQQFRWRGADRQRWRIEKMDGDYYRVVNVGTGRCLDVEGKNRSDGANIQQWTCSGQDNQTWRLER